MNGLQKLESTSTGGSLLHNFLGGKCSGSELNLSLKCYVCWPLRMLSAIENHFRNRYCRYSLTSSLKDTKTKRELDMEGTLHVETY